MDAHRNLNLKDLYAILKNNKRSVHIQSDLHQQVYEYSCKLMITWALFFFAQGMAAWMKALGASAVMMLRRSFASIIAVKKLIPATRLGLLHCLCHATLLWAFCCGPFGP